jgi:hypothetical protein
MTVVPGPRGTLWIGPTSHEAGLDRHVALLTVALALLSAGTRQRTQGAPW